MSISWGCSTHRKSKAGGKNFSAAKKNPQRSREGFSWYIWHPSNMTPFLLWHKCDKIKSIFLDGLCQAFLGTLIKSVYPALYFCTLVPATARPQSLASPSVGLGSKNQEPNIADGL